MHALYKLVALLSLLSILITGLAASSEGRGQFLPISNFLPPAVTPKSNHNYSRAVTRLHKKAAAEMRSRQLEKACRTYTRAIKLDKRDVLSFYNRSSCYFSLGKLQASIAGFTRVIELNPRFAMAYNDRALAYAYFGQPRKAIHDYSKAIGLGDRQFTEGYYSGRAFQKERLNLLAEAIEDYSSVLSLSHDKTWRCHAYYSRGNLRGLLGQTDKAIDDFTRALEIDPQFECALESRAKAFRDLGLHRKEIADLSTLLNFAPTHGYADLYLQRAYAYNNSDEYEKAIADCNRAIELYPNYPSAYIARAWTNEHMELYEEVVDDCTKALNLDPQSLEALSNRAFAYGRLGQYQRQIADLSRAIELNPKDAKNYRECFWAHQKLGDYSKVAEQCAVVLSPIPLH
jgi:tetratricopeptide (TPR) repeat protein